jgi:hypothetical protein
MNPAIELARLRYWPMGQLELLFIAEAPPADPGRFFYFDQVDTADWLYLALMRALFADARELDAPRLRSDKPDYLARFRDAGFYLIDACDSPMPKGITAAGKRRRLTASLQDLLRNTCALSGPDTRIVLISRSVFDVCYAPLKSEGLNVINTAMIDFPSSGRQAEFARKLRAALHASDTHLQSTIRGIQASLEYFGTGDAKKRLRERWVVEHFLRGLGLTFDPAEIEHSVDEPPDARFHGAAFEVKELQEPERRRGDEYRQKLKQAKAATSSEELLEHFTPQDMPIAEAFRMVMVQTRQLATEKYVIPADRERLDLLFYLSLDMAVAWDIEDGARPDVAPLVAEGWRSVSFLHGSRTACVMHASDSAPDFLRSKRGRLIDSGSSE